MIKVLRRVALATTFLSALGLGASAPAADSAWWHDYTTIASHPSGKDLEQVQADCYRSPAGYGGWYGFWYYDFQSPGDGPSARAARIIDAGARPLAFFDAGEIGHFAMLVDEDNEPIVHAWDWHTWDGQDGEARWFGLETFMNNVAWAPYPTADAYGLKPFTTPSGDPIPEGELYEVLTTRWVDGTWRPLEFSNPRITDAIAEASGLAALSHKQESAPEVQGGTGWVTGQLPIIDRTNPQMVDYHCQEIAYLIKRLRPAGVHVDNMADTNVFCPSVAAFGQWSSHTFRGFLRERMTVDQLTAFGIEDVDTFEIREYMLGEYVGGNKMGGIHLTDARWLDDPIWKAYLIHKTETGMEYARRVYHAAKAAAREAGIECCVFGNIIPLFPGSELAHGFCDVAHFEWKSEGAYPQLPELGLPPAARSAYVVRLGRAISDVSYTWPSLYVPKRLTGPDHTNLHKVQAFECFANGGIMDYGQWYLDNYSPGTDESAGFINRVIKTAAPVASGREFVADIGLVFCPWTSIAATDGQGSVPELFLDEYKGWCDYLCNKHYQWDVLLSQHIDAERLAQFKVVVLPSILVVTDEQARAFQDYVDQGGRLVITGQSGTRYGPERFLTSREQSILSELANHQRVRQSPERPGRRYFTGEATDDSAQQKLAGLLAFPDFGRVLETDAPWTSEITFWHSPDAPRLFLDIVNTNLEVETDALTPTPSSRVTLTLSGLGLPEVSTVSLLEATSEPQWAALDDEQWQYDPESNTLSLSVSSFDHYRMYMVE